MYSVCVCTGEIGKCVKVAKIGRGKATSRKDPVKRFHVSGLYSMPASGA